MSEARPGQVYSFDVDDVGSFFARRRTMNDSAAIPNRAISILGGVPSHPIMLQQATKLAELEMLIVGAPDGWDLAGLDPLDQDDQELIDAVHGGLRDAEERFRRSLREKRSALGRAAQSE